MITYLSSPGSQMQADHCRNMPVLLSYGAYTKKSWIAKWAPSFSRLLIDSGAFSELNTGAKIDLNAYSEWARGFPCADAVAALDDISGNWQRSLHNWDRYPWMFPTFHDTDPWEYLEEILSRDPKWIGLGMNPPRTSRVWLDRTLAKIPPDVHVHGWALRAFTDRPRIDSFDSTNWFLDSFKINQELPWLTPGEAVELVVKRYQREVRMSPKTEEQCLFQNSQ